MPSELRRRDRRSPILGRPIGPRRARAGSEIVELVLTLPVLILIGLGIVSFGLFFSNRQQVALASRVGAEEASQTASLPTSGDVPQNILDAITRQLESSSIKVYGVRVEHNVTAGGPYVLESSGAGASPCGPTETFDPDPAYAPLLGKYVRVTVCVEMTELMPNLLARFGASVCGRVAQATTIFRHEGS